MKIVANGVFLDIVLGILDGILGGRIFGKLVIRSSGGMIGSIMVAFVGAWSWWIKALL